VLTCLPPTAPIRTTEPTLLQEPVTVAEARKQCRLADSIDYHDQDLIRYIVSARQEVEHDAGIVCYTGAFTWTITEFPSRSWLEIPSVRPVTAIGVITYIDTAGTSQTWASSNYERKEMFRRVPVLALTYGNIWPTLRGDINGVTINFTAGYASVQAIPSSIKSAVLLKLHEMWLLDNGEDPKNQVMAYERQIELIRRDIYA
jgi:uncharacterized phiE125 gp8 family phage protein